MANFKKVKEFSKTIETICTELTIPKKKLCILFAYRPPDSEKKSFFEQISSRLSLIVTDIKQAL